VLFSELAASRPLANEVAALRAQIALAVRRMLEESLSDACALPALETDAIAHGIVGSGESLANWWLAHPEVEREQMAQWYVGIVQAAAAGAARRTRRRH
jgi:ribulose-5-phosphate 4-epimerase/fuculose-1-phosphate aldolase